MRLTSSGIACAVLARRLPGFGHPETTRTLLLHFSRQEERSYTLYAALDQNGAASSFV